MNIPTKFGSNGPGGMNSEGDCKSLQTKMTTTDVKWWQYLAWDVTRDVGDTWRYT